MPLSAIHIGASGFSYADWVGPFYPPGTRRGDFLSYYAQHFQALEINYTYYRMPTAATMNQILEKAGKQMRFSVKLTDLFTHRRCFLRQDVLDFAAAMAPLAEAGQLTCLLAQFPSSFQPTRANWTIFKQLLEQFSAFPMVVEFRRAEWATTRLFDWLARAQVGYACVDEPALPGLLPPQDLVTSPLGYVRFHGRNGDKWWRHERAEERYDYRYSSEELREWLPRLRRMATQSEELLVFFNNHFEGKALDNAQELKRLLALE